VGAAGETETQQQQQQEEGVSEDFSIVFVNALIRCLEQEGVVLPVSLVIWTLFLHSYMGLSTTAAAAAAAAARAAAAALEEAV
jgi:hypothetical protein